MKRYILLLLLLALSSMALAAGGQTPVPGTNLPAMSDGPHGYSNGNYLKSTASGWTWAAGGGGITPGQSAAFNNVTARGKFFGDGSKLTGISARPNSYANVSGMATGAMPKSGGTFTGPVSGVSLGNDLMANHFKMIAASCDNGSTLPSSPVIGQWFLHTPTGRQTLCIYTGSEWEATMSLGTTTVYVDATNGTDSQDKGYGTGANAYKTTQFAVDNVGDIFCGNVTANISSDVYRETVIVQGKMPCGNYTFSLIGTWTTALADTTATSAAARTSATASASITKTSAGWTVNAYQYKMLYIASGTGSGQYRPILSNTADTISVEEWATTPDNTSHFLVYDWATIISGAGGVSVDVKPGQGGVILQNMKFSDEVFLEPMASGWQISNCSINKASGSYALFAQSTAGSSSGSVNNCLINGQARLITSYALFLDNYFNGAGGVLAGLQADGGGSIGLYRNRFNNWTNGLYGLQGATILATSLKNSITNCTVGAFFTQGGIPVGVPGNLFFATNTTDSYITGLSKSSGTATLSGGTITVANTKITASDIVLVTSMPGGANRGWAYVDTITAGTSFIIKSSNTLDSSPVSWQIITP